MSTDLKQQYGPWVIIAGGSEGIGRAFAQQLAAQGLNLLLLARKPARALSLGGGVARRQFFSGALRAG